MASCTSVEVDRRVAQGRPPEPRGDEPDRPDTARIVSIGIGIAFVVVALFVYTASRPHRYYDHFEWQAQAFLEGRAAIRYPVGPTADSPGNAFFQDVLPVVSDDGVPRGLVPFPPLPAIVLLPFVAAWGRDVDGQLLFALLGAIDVGLAWWVLGRLPVRRWVRAASTVFFGFGTVFWYAAQLGTTWYQAHVVAVGLVLLSLGIALEADHEAPTPGRAGGWLGGRIDRRQLVAGFLFGLACTARLTVLFAAPFYLLVGGGGSVARRGLSAGLGAGIPVAALVVYNLVTTGQVLHPGYQHLYELEATFYPALGYNLAWGIEDVRYIPQNLGIMLFGTPVLAPDVVPAALGGGRPVCVDPAAVRGLFDPACPLVLPRDTGMSVLLTSPGYLLAVPALWARRPARLVAGALLAVVLVAIVNLMHFSQGWVQFGYRFSNDFAPWALLLVALGLDRLRRPGQATLGIALVGLSVAVNLWGVTWGKQLGW